MTRKSPAAPTVTPLEATAEAPDRRPITQVTRLPYALLVLIALVVVGIIGAVTVRERFNADREMVGLGFGDDVAAIEQAIRHPQPA